MAAGLEKVREIAERVAQSSGLEVVDIELLGGGKVRMLRIFIDKPDGVTHEDCSSYSREVGTIFQSNAATATITAKSVRAIAPRRIIHATPFS